MVINFPTRLIVFFMLLLVSAVTFAALDQEYSVVTSDVNSKLVLPKEAYPLLVAEKKSDSSSKSQQSNNQLIPSNEEDNFEKQCVTVCDEWGNDCIINPSTGTRKCRRMCKSFGKECF